MASPSSPPFDPGVHMCVNKRREPTTDTESTRRAVRNLNFRTGGETYGVVRSLREIVSRVHRAYAGACSQGAHKWLAGFLRSAGIFWAGRSSFSTGNGRGTGHMSRIAHPCSVKQRKPGTHWGAVSSGTGRGVFRRWGVTRDGHGGAAQDARGRSGRAPGGAAGAAGRGG
ncbi:hypothetical protein DDJ31_06450 [Streptomyces griseoviridis]|nr:hypothetical protein DDJ31_06450 [Streptomyces griseoviridis]